MAMENLVSDGLKGLDSATQSNLLLGLQVLFFLAAFRVLWLQFKTGRIRFALKKKKGKSSVHYVGLLYWGLCVLFLGTLGYQASWQLMGLFRPEFVGFMQRYDKRHFNPARQLNRGKILDRNSVVLATNEKTADGVKRVYPFGPKMAHIIGYVHPKYGLNGVEKAMDGFLAGTRAESMKDWEQLGKNLLTQEKAPGGKDIRLTLDAALQSAAYDLLGARKGAVIVMGIRSGALYTVCSRPGFDPNQLRAQTFLEAGRTAPLLNRAIRGLYPPGSTFKIAMGAYALEHGLPDLINCERGFQTSKGMKPIRDHIYYDRERQGRTWGGYGKIGLGTAIAESSNVYFANLGVQAGNGGFRWLSDRMAFNRPITLIDGADGKIQSAASRLPGLKSRDQYGLAQMGIGQGKLAVTPLQMALLTAAVANEGVAPSPRLLTGQKPEALGRFMSNATANKLGVMLRRVVTDGTAKKASQLPWALAGKTGTAENRQGASHSWFTGYFPFELPQLVVCVVVENGGYGSAAALPITIGVIREAARLGLFKMPGGK
jgi:peptidoglycan glycosyltransferase